MAEDEGLDGWDRYLDRSRPHGVDDCLLVRRLLSENYPPEGSHPRHVDLKEFLYFEAFKELRLPLLPYRRKFSSSDDPAAAARYRGPRGSSCRGERIPAHPSR